MIEISWNPSCKELRFFAGGLVCLALALMAFGLAYWNWPGWAAAMLVALATAVTLLALFQPFRLKPVYLGWMVAVFPIGWVVSQVVLATVYFTVFLTIGLILRVRGHNPLRNRSDRSGKSGWLKKEPPASRDRYFRQY